MLHYYIVYGLLVFFAVLFSKYKPSDLTKQNRNFCIVFFLLWTLVIGLRHPSMGVDLQYGRPNGYWGSYSVIGARSWADAATKKYLNYEQGYIFFNKVLFQISEDPQFLLFICTMFFIGVFTVMINDYSDYPFLSGIIFSGLPCFMIIFSGLRQAIAIGITVIAHYMIRKKKPIFFFLLVLLATTFHKSSAMFFLAYPLYYLKMNKTASTISVLLPPVVFLFRQPLFAFLSRLLRDDAVPDNNNALTLFLVLWAVYIFAVLFGHEEDREELGLRNLFLVACCCQAFGGLYNLALRVGYYFMTSMILLLPKLITNNSTAGTQHLSDRRSSFIMYVSILVCFFVFGLYCLAHSSWPMSNPHSFFWQ